jgi:hypothetical protein
MNKRSMITVSAAMLLPALLVLFWGRYAAGAEKQSDLLSTLKDRDAILDSGAYAITFGMQRRANLSDPNQGRVLLDCRVAQNGVGSLAMRITYHYETDPIFVPPNSRRSTSAEYYQGNWVVWRTMEKYVLSSPARNVVIERVKALMIDPNNRVTLSGENTGAYYWPIGSDNSAYEFFQFLQGIGRGYSKHLARTVSTKIANGLVTAAADGSYGSEIPGTWELSVDPNSDWIVRSASYRFSGLDEPSVVVKNEGVFSKDDIRIARYGTYKAPAGLELSINVDDIAKGASAAKGLIDEVTGVVDSPLPIGAFIVDMRKLPPVRTTVK